MPNNRPSQEEPDQPRNQQERGELDYLSSYLQAIWRRRLLIVCVTLLCGLAAFAVSHLLPEVYEATATMIVIAPQFRTELSPPALSVETYEAIAKSDGILAKVYQALRDKGISSPRADFSFSTSVQLSRARGNTPYLPLVELTVASHSPENAQLAANTWARVLAYETADLAGREKQGTLEFIEHQYPQSEQILFEREIELKERKDFYDRAILKLGTDWGERLSQFETETKHLSLAYKNVTSELLLEFENQTAEQVSTHQKETERLRLEFLDRWQPEAHKEKLRAKRATLAEMESRHLASSLEVSTLEKRLAQLSQQVEGQPQLLVLAKAITDQALWDQVSQKAKQGLPDFLSDLKLRSETINPVHQRLMEYLIRGKVDYESALALRDRVSQEIERLEQEIDFLSEQITQREIDLFSLLKDRENELGALRAGHVAKHEQLVDSRATGLNVLVNDRMADKLILEKRSSSELQLLNRQAGLEVDRLEREKNNAKDTYEILASKYKSVMPARYEENENVKVGAEAIAPQNHVSPRIGLNTMVALALGFFISILIALVVEYAQTDSWSLQRKASGARKLGALAPRRMGSQEQA